MADAINGDEHSEIHSVGGRNPVTLQDFAEKYAVPHTFTDYDALINDPAVDIVYIALPNHLHHHYIEKAAAVGKAILCEKSLSVDMDKAQLALAFVNQHQV